MFQRKTLALLAAAFAACCGTALADRSGSSNLGAGDRGVLQKKYLEYRNRQLASSQPGTVVVALGAVKGLSRSFLGVSGTVALDLAAGTFQAELSGLVPGETYALWLLDQPEGRPAGDLAAARTVKLGDLGAAGTTASLRGSLAGGALEGFEIDRVVLSAAGPAPAGVIASGSMSVLQKLFFRSAEAADGTAATPAPQPFARLVPPAARPRTDRRDNAPRSERAPSASPLDTLVAQGARLFFDEKFGGNGRTCGTCHPASRNFTIDAEFISRLRPDDPLFVAEFNPALAQLERPALMRRFGLILENLDGLDDPAGKFVMRSVPHTLGMQVSLATDASRTNPPAAMTGWSGDGAPGTGSLREFALGAVTQHFTRTLDRVPGRDFILPSEEQLDAMEAFQLSLGRSADPDLARLTFLDAGVANGQALFVNGTGDPAAGGRCNACHVNGGALAANGQNRNFNTNVEDVVHPARSIENYPRDGGFGPEPDASGAFGDGSFNTTSVVEAADTAPFFHNNVVNTLEEVVQFYGGPVFNAPRGAGGRFSFTPAQVTDIANFMRGLNTLQNVDLARNALNQALALDGDRPQARLRLQAGLADLDDAIRVLREGGIFTPARERIAEARRLAQQSDRTDTDRARQVLLEQAIAALDAAQAQIAVMAP
jgi:mono/diheme cytochrome c family protein